MSTTVTRSEATYLRIARDIEHRVVSGELGPGDRVPSTRQITRDWGVAIATATRALAELRQRGVIRVAPGVGSVVAPATATVDTPAVAPARTPEPVRHRDTRSRGTSREDVLRTAVRIADAEGMAAVSMRRIATELDVATMSLYRWVPSKDDLVVGMLDAVLGAGDWPDPPPAGWRAQLDYLARRHWAGYRAHPWLPRVVSLTRPQLAPDAMLHTEWGLRAVSGLGLDGETMLRVVLTVIGHTQGTAISLEQEAHAERDTGLTSDEWMQTQDAQFAAIMSSGRYPTLAGLSAQSDIDVSLDRLFEFGLEVILDGLAHLIGDAGTRP